jgi:hypothetical protein
MDDADRAEDLIEHTLEDGLAKIRARMSYRELQPCGSCHYCNSYVDGNRLFCCAECSEDHEKVMKQIRINGK